MDNKFYIETKKRLEDKNTANVIATLKELKSTGTPKILPLIFDLWATTTSEEIKSYISSMVATLKNKESARYMAEEVQRERLGDYQQDLISACWQSGLDFSQYMNVFAAQFIKGNYQIALESFTVIEESLHNATKVQIESCKEVLIAGVSNIFPEKKPLYTELIKLLNLPE